MLGQDESKQHCERSIRRHCTSDDEKDGDVGLGGTLVEVDGADGDHAERDDDGDAARDGAADGAEQQQQNFDQKVDEVPRGLKFWQQLRIEEKLASMCWISNLVFHASHESMHGFI